MSNYDLFGAWFRVADWCAYDLAKDGYEGLVLQPLGQFPNAAATIVRSAAQSEEYIHRKIGASLAGWIDAPDSKLLQEIWQLEVVRDDSLPPEDEKRLDCQSVMEDIGFSASRWARKSELHTPAFQLLNDIVEQTINGRYWNTASYAMTTLTRYSAPGAKDLLTRFGSFANGPPPIHPCNPNLTQEKAFAANLLAGNDKTLNVIEGLLTQKDDACNTPLDEASQSTIDSLFETARSFEAAISDSLVQG